MKRSTDGASWRFWFLWQISDICSLNLSPLVWKMTGTRCGVGLSFPKADSRPHYYDLLLKKSYIGFGLSLIRVKVPPDQWSGCNFCIMCLHFIPAHKTCNNISLTLMSCWLSVETFTVPRWSQLSFRGFSSNTITLF